MDLKVNAQRVENALAATQVSVPLRGNGSESQRELRNFVQTFECFRPLAG